MAPKKRTTRASPATTTTTTPVTNAQLKALIDQGVADALVARDANRSQNGEDNHDFGRGIRRQAPPPRECTYQDFMKCKPLYFKGTEGVVELTQWFERMKNVFCKSNCTMENQIRFVTCTLLESAWTWWSSYIKTVGPDVAYAMTWTNLKKKMTDKYCPRGKIKKLEVELGNLKVKGTDLWLPNMIHESVMESKEKTMQDSIEFTTELMDKKISTFAERQTENKRKQDHNQQQENKRSFAATNNQRNLTCYECGNQGHYKSDCPKLKNQNHGNQAGVISLLDWTCKAKNGQDQMCGKQTMIEWLGLEVGEHLGSLEASPLSNIKRCMQTRSSSKFVGKSSTNPTSTILKHRNRRRSKQRVELFALEEVPKVTMADQRTMAELLRAPTEGYAEAIIVPPILAEHFELKHSLINLVTSKQFFGFKKEDPHAHI
uniref:CCHC-type domain-containing protein n=1 Tax=Tanacetum cinerariifolium TaxID=118510 RepID=A0A6L2KKX2_TANCI|nr:hypothetical protein [Tanacetum cinerariifolium]